MTADRAPLLAALGVELPEELLTIALTHRSYSYENGGLPTNERLEFLGDAVLGFVVADHVYRNEDAHDEGVLTDVRKAVVNAVCLAEVAADLDLGAHVLLGKGEESSGGREKPSILADCMEAVLGAVYLDGGLDVVTDLVLRLVGDRIQSAVDAGGGNQDHKSRLQERLATETTLPLRYRFEAAGPDHAREFTVTVTAGEHALGTGTGRSKKQAEQQAARAALESLDDLDAPLGDPPALTGDHASDDTSANPPGGTSDG